MQTPNKCRIYHEIRTDVLRSTALYQNYFCVYDEVTHFYFIFFKLKKFAYKKRLTCKTKTGVYQRGAAIAAQHLDSCTDIGSSSLCFFFLQKEKKKNSSKKKEGAHVSHHE
jgi:hypothetical protein